MYPLIFEQHRIVDRINSLCSSSDQTANKLVEQITLLAEYRTRLVSDVVTGKLDVRGVVVPEYEEVEDVADVENESEALDGEPTEDGEE